MNKTHKTTRGLYLSYVNDFLTVERFAEYHGLDVAQASHIIRYERRREQSPDDGQYQATIERFPSYRHHHLPVWFKKQIRQTAVDRGDWEAGTNPDDYIYRDANNRERDIYVGGIWDHYGSVSLEGQKERAMILQPYGSYRGAQAFFAEYGLSCAVEPFGPYHPYACLITLTQMNNAE
jgi:hypothetical protein